MGRCHVNYEEFRGCVHLEQSPPCTGILFASPPLLFVLAISDNGNMEMKRFVVHSFHINHILSLIFSMKNIFYTEIYTMGYVSLIFPSEIWYFDEFQFETFPIIENM